MKIEQKNLNFEPISIILETEEEEAKAFINIIDLVDRDVELNTDEKALVVKISDAFTSGNAVIPNFNSTVDRNTVEDDSKQVKQLIKTYRQCTTDT